MFDNIERDNMFLLKKNKHINVLTDMIVWSIENIDDRSSAVVRTTGH